MCVSSVPEFCAWHQRKVGCVSSIIFIIKLVGIICSVLCLGNSQMAMRVIRAAYACQLLAVKVTTFSVGNISHSVFRKFVHSKVGLTSGVCSLR